MPVLLSSFAAPGPANQATDTKSQVPYLLKYKLPNESNVKNIFLNICKFPENKIHVIPPTYELENNKIEIQNKSSNKKDFFS